MRGEQYKPITSGSAQVHSGPDSIIYTPDYFNFV